MQLELDQVELAALLGENHQVCLRTLNPDLAMGHFVEKSFLLSLALALAHSSFLDPVPRKSRRKDRVLLVSSFLCVRCPPCKDQAS